MQQMLDNAMQGILYQNMITLYMANPSYSTDEYADEGIMAWILNINI